MTSWPLILPSWVLWLLLVGAATTLCLIVKAFKRKEREEHDRFMESIRLPEPQQRIALKIERIERDWREIYSGRYELAYSDDFLRQREEEYRKEGNVLIEKLTKDLGVLVKEGRVDQCRAHTALRHYGGLLSRVWYS